MPTLEGSMDNKEKITKSCCYPMKVHQIQNIFRYKLERKKTKETSVGTFASKKYLPYKITLFGTLKWCKHPSWKGSKYILKFPKYLFPLLLSPPSSRVELCSAHTPFFANWRKSMTQNCSWVSLFLSFFNSIAQTIPCYLCTKGMHWNEKKSKTGDVKNSTNLL